jgi:hypothetical protein
MESMIRSFQLAARITLADIQFSESGRLGPFAGGIDKL